jgi:hypothetical protein
MEQLVSERLAHTHPGEPVSYGSVTLFPLYAEVFDKPSTFSRLRSKLVESYAFDAIEEELGEAKVPTARDVGAFLSRAAEAQAEVFDSVSLGKDVRLKAPEFLGAALVHEGAVLHAALFAQPAEGASEGKLNAPGAQDNWGGAMLAHYRLC